MPKVINREIMRFKRFAINLVTYPEDHRVMRHNDPVSEGKYYKFNHFSQKQVGYFVPTRLFLTYLTVCISLGLTCTVIVLRPFNKAIENYCRWQYYYLSLTFSYLGLHAR